MDKQSKESEWTKDEKAAFRKFWGGDIGKKYLKRMEETRKQLLQAAMGSPERDAAFRFAAIANGIDSILLDIEVMSKEETKEKEAAAKKK